MNLVPGAADVIVVVLVVVMMVGVILEEFLTVSTMRMGRQEVRLVVGRQLGGRVGGGRRAVR